MDTHPYNAPLAYVKPTVDMQIKVSMYVDYNGKIYLPYLHEWQPVCEWFGGFQDTVIYKDFFLQNSSDLLGLIQVMVVTFGDYPPVYSKPKETATPYPPQC